MQKKETFSEMKADHNNQYIKKGYFLGRPCRLSWTASDIIDCPGTEWPDGPVKVIG